MAVARIALVTTRAIQILIGAVILGLSLKAVSWQRYGATPSPTGFATFVGSFSLLTALLGLAVYFLSRFEKPMLIADALAAAMLFAAGISYAIGLKGVDCGDRYADGTWKNTLIDEGAGAWAKRQYGADWEYYGVRYDGLLKRCKIAEADAVFMFLGFLAAVGALGLGLVALREPRRGRGGAGGGV